MKTILAKNNMSMIYKKTHYMSKKVTKTNDKLKICSDAQN